MKTFLYENLFTIIIVVKGCPYFRMPKQEIDPHVYSSDIELYTCSLLPRSLIIQLLARNVDLELTIKLVDLCHREETEDGRQEADENWIQMLDHLYFSVGLISITCSEEINYLIQRTTKKLIFQF